MVQSILLLLVGFVLLIKGADFFVSGSSSVAQKLRVPSIIVGLTIVAMGTSLPECAVSVTASLAGNNALSISNAVGSNIFNLLVVCGCCSLFAPLAIDKNTMKKEFPFSIFCGALLLALGAMGMILGHLDGAVLLIIFAVYLFLMVKNALKARSSSEEEEAESSLSWGLCIIYIVGGMAAIKFGGDFVVNSASDIALTFGLSQNLVGLTIVAVGTSLPELVTSIVAARKNEVDMAVGNVIGSNIFNILFVLGIASAISPIQFIMENIIDLGVFLGVSVLTYIFALTKNRIEKMEGISMLVLYAVYLVYICLR